MDVPGQAGYGRGPEALKRADLEAGPGNGPFHKSSFLLYLLFVPVFLGLILILLAIMQWKQLRMLVAPEPVVAPRAEASRAVEDSLQALLQAFLVAPGKDTLDLGAEELNHLARASKTLKDLGWTYHMQFEDTLAVIRTSVPAQEMKGPASFLIKLFRIKGYLNSEVHAYPRLEGEKLTIVPVRAMMNKEAAPATALTRRGEINPRDWVSDTAAYDRALERLTDVRIRRGRLLLVRKA